MQSGSPFRAQGGAITSVEAFVLGVVTAILVAIAIPSYLTMRDRASDSSARAQLREAAEQLDARRAERGSASVNSSTACLQRTVGGRTWHLTFPDRTARRGSCP